jgi:hypothetical protein
MNVPCPVLRSFGRKTEARWAGGLGKGVLGVQLIRQPEPIQPALPPRELSGTGPHRPHGWSFGHSLSAVAVGSCVRRNGHFPHTRRTTVRSAMLRV